MHPRGLDAAGPQSRVDLREAFNLAMHSSGSTNGSSLADSPCLSGVGLSTGGRGVVEQALQQSQVYAATHLGVGSGQIPYGAGAQPNDPFPSDDLLAVSR